MSVIFAIINRMSMCKTM